MAGERDPLDPLTPDDIGVYVVVVCYSLASVSVVVTIIRYSLSALRKVAFGLDDAAYVLANVRVTFNLRRRLTDSIPPGRCHHQHRAVASGRHGRTRTAFGRTLSR